MDVGYSDCARRLSDRYSSNSLSILTVISLQSMCSRPKNWHNELMAVM